MSDPHEDTIPILPERSSHGPQTGLGELFERKVSNALYAEISATRPSTINLLLINGLFGLLAGPRVASNCFSYHLKCSAGGNALYRRVKCTVL